jgi:hypothetical protein
LDFLLSAVSPDSHHALAWQFDLTRFDVDTVQIVPLLPGVLAFGAAWSHDSTRLCVGTDSIGYVFGADGTTGTPMPTAIGSTGECSWSYDDASLAWVAGNKIFTVPASGGVATEVTGSAPSDRSLGFAGWSPTEPRLAFTLEGATSDWRGFTVALGSPRVEIDDSIRYLAGWSGDGRFLTYARIPTPLGVPPITAVRCAPAAGPLGAAIDLVPASPTEVGPFSISPRGTWMAFSQSETAPGESTDLVVAPLSGAAPIRVHGTGFRFSWSSADVLAFVDEAVGGGLFVLDIAAGTAPVRAGPALATDEEIEDLTWAPDGSAVAYSRSFTSDSGSSSKMCVVGTSDLTERCVPTLDAGGPQWSWDGESLAFRGGGGDVYITKAASFAPVKVDVASGGTLGFWWVRR